MNSILQRNLTLIMGRNCLKYLDKYVIWHHQNHRIYMHIHMMVNITFYVNRNSQRHMYKYSFLYYNVLIIKIMMKYIKYIIIN
jgi:hypothetical protein